MAATRIELPEQLEAYVDFKVKTGLYSNGAEVLRDAVRHMMEGDEDAAKFLRLREAVTLGFEQIERGEGVLYTPKLMQEAKNRARARAQQGHQPKPEVAP